MVDDAPQRAGWEDLVDRVADPVGKVGGLFDPRPGLRPDMHLDLPAIDAGEEVLAQIRGKPERKEGEADEPGDQLGTVVQTEREQTAVGAADGLEAALETLLESHQRIAPRLVRDGTWITVLLLLKRIRPPPLLAYPAVRHPRP